VPPFSADELESKAVSDTGLDDFGVGAWRDGLHVLCDALAREARLNEAGWATFEALLGNHLRQRLGVVDWIRRHPEISEQKIRRPVIVVGLPRTGTTALAHLMAADPDSRTLRTWEAQSPTPPPDVATARRDPRIAATQAGIDLSHRLIPDLPRLYFSTATSPSETLDLLGMSGRAWQLEGQAHVPSYEEWLLACDMNDAYRFEAEVLRLLQWRCPPDRWTWKNPPDLFFLDDVRIGFPDAVFVWTHRDPAAVLSSVCSLIAVVRSVGTDHPDLAALGPRQTELWAEAVTRGLSARARHGEAAFVDVWMDDLAADPLGTVATLYERLGWTLTDRAEAGMHAWLTTNPRHGRGGHEPAPADFGLDPAAVRDRFRAYTDRFGGRDA
jgi:sulfotransferase family protein